MARKKKLEIFDDEKDDELKDEGIEVILEESKKPLPEPVLETEPTEDFIFTLIKTSEQMYNLVKYVRNGRKEELFRGSKAECIKEKTKYEMVYPGEKCNLVIKRMVGTK